MSLSLTMNYNYDRKKSYKSWITKKEKEENELRNKGVNETYIMLLREMDKRMFNEKENINVIRKL